MSEQPPTSDPPAPPDAPKPDATTHLKSNAGPKAAFLAAFAETGIVATACRSAGVGRSTYYDWIRVDAEFAAACEDAKKDAIDRMVAEARRRAVEGVIEERVDKNGQPYTIHKYSDVLLIFLLKAADPATFRDNPKVAVTNITTPAEQHVAVGGMTPAEPAKTAKIRADLRALLLGVAAPEASPTSREPP